MKKLLFRTRLWWRASALFLLLVGFSLISLPCNADSETSTEIDSDKPFVAIELDCSLCVFLRLDEISSVSLHRYRLNGSIPMIEATVDIKGNNSIRFFTEYRTETKPSVYVTKHYPEGVHTHTVEYKVASVNGVKNIYAQIVEALMQNKGGVIVAQPGEY